MNNFPLDMLGLWYELEDTEEQFCLWQCLGADGELSTYLWDTDSLNLEVLEELIREVEVK